MIELVEDKDNKSYMLNGKKYTSYVLKNNEWRWYRKKMIYGIPKWTSKDGNMTSKIKKIYQLEWKEI